MSGYPTYFISSALPCLDGLPSLSLYRQEWTSTPLATLQPMRGGRSTSEEEKGNSCDTLQSGYSNDQVLTVGDNLQE